MAEFVLMPKLGFNMETGQIVSWHKQEGESIGKGDVLVEISTDKTVMEIESTLTGIVRKLLVPEGETVPVILPIAIIGTADENIDSLYRDAMAQLGRTDSSPDSIVSGVDSGDTSPGEISPGPALITEAVATSPDISEVKLSPRARAFVAKHKLEVTSLAIQGTGFQGGVTAEDLEEYVKSDRHKITPLAQKIADQNTVDLSRVEGTGVGGKITKADVVNQLPKASSDTRAVSRQSLSDSRAILKTLSYSGMRKVIGDRLSQSKFTAPHLYFTTSVDVYALMMLREQVNSSQEVKVSLNDFIMGAVIKGLQEYPELNSALLGDEIIQYQDVNIGIAVGLETGLIVPNIKKAQLKKITELAKESRALIDKAHHGRLMPDEYQEGTFTISNLGMFGIENFTAIINPPEAGILSVSAVKKTPVVVEQDGEEKILIRPILNMTLSVDHRIIDGLTATRFINKVKELLEKPFAIIV